MNKTSSHLNKLALLLGMAVIVLAACKKENSGEAAPAISQVRLLDSTARDSFFTQALPGTLLVIQGSNFDGLTNVFFNDLDATFNAALNSSTNIIVRVPANTPTIATNPDASNEIKVVTTHGTATYSFQVVAPPPAITSVSNENAVAGSTITINGSNFYLLSGIQFPNSINVTDFTVNADATQITVKVPAEITTGDSLRVTGHFGTGVSPFVFENYLSPSTGFLANFECCGTYFGWQWWGGNSTGDGSLFPNNTGTYIEVHPSGAINAGDGGWYSDNRAVMVAASPWVSTDDMSDPIANYALKFEISVKVPWTGGSFMIAPNGNFNIMARYAPYEDTPSGQFVTNGWVTATVPLTSFLSGSGSYNPSGSPAANFAALLGGGNSVTLQLMLYNDGTTTLSAFDAAVDNVRIVKIK